MIIFFFSLYRCAYIQKCTFTLYSLHIMHNGIDRKTYYMILLAYSPNQTKNQCFHESLLKNLHIMPGTLVYAKKLDI
jgi:hypothetical protein